MKSYKNINHDNAHFISAVHIPINLINEHLLSVNPRATSYLHLAQIFIDEGEKEGVRGDGAFCQALIETGYFMLGGDVQLGQHNYTGLGATGGVPGLTFLDDRTGVRAQIQHLNAYATTEPLTQDCVRGITRVKGLRVDV